MFRDPEEIRKGIGTLNSKPILFDHKPISADNHDHALTVGTTGTDAAFDGKYGVNSMALWSRKAIRAVESNSRRELSCGYRYRPDMTPGEYQGLPYDGVIRDIEFNHVALVVQGRAGPDVLVGDEAMKLKSRTGILAHGAIMATIAPKLKPGSAIDLAPALEGVTGASLAMDGAPAALADKVKEIVAPFLAQDQNVDNLAEALAYVTPIAQDEDAIADPVKADDKKDDKTSGKAAVAEIKKDDPPAMDEATVATMIAAAVAKTRAEGVEIGIARDAVRPLVGELVAMDSAAAIYKVGLDHLKVDLTGVPDSGYKAMFGALAKATDKTPIAQDAAPTPSVLTEVDKMLSPFGKVY
jgi:hypothetical protein